MQRGVYFDAWFPRQHCYHPSLPPRRLRMIDDLVDYRATTLVWAALGGGSLALPYLEQEAFGPVDARSRFYGFVNDAEFIAACHERGIAVFGIVFEAQGWEFPVELDEAEETVLALNELRGVGRRGWLGLREFSQDRYPRLWPSFESYFPGGLHNSDGEPVTDLIEECVARNIHQEPCRAHWVECPDRDHRCYYMDRNNPVWREYLKAIIRIQIDAGVDGIQLDEAELPLGAMQYGACFCKDCMKQFRAYLAELPAERLPSELAGVDLAAFHYGDWLLERGYDFVQDRPKTPLYGAYYAFQCRAIATRFAELARYAREYGRAQGREVRVSGNFFNLDPHYLPLADEVDLVITEMRNTTYRQPEWYRRAAAFARQAGDKDVIVVENPYGGVVPELAEAMAAGRRYDLMRLSLYEATAFGVNLSVPYGSWMGSRIHDSFWAPHELLVEVQDFIADHDQLIGDDGRNQVLVIDSVASNRELIGKADTSDNVLNARDDTVEVPYRVVTETLSRDAVPFDVVIFTDGETAADRTEAAALSGYRVIVAPACWWLTDRQGRAVLEALEAGVRLIVTGELGTDLEPALRDALLGHEGTEVAEASRVVDRLDRQVTLDRPLAINLHRLADGTAAHLINYDYDEAGDRMVAVTDIHLGVRLDHDVAEAVLHRPGAEPTVLEVVDDGAGRSTVIIDRVDVYGIVEFRPMAETGR